MTHNNISNINTQIHISGVQTDLNIVHDQGSISLTDVTIPQLNIKWDGPDVGNNTEYKFEIL